MPKRCVFPLDIFVILCYSFVTLKNNKILTKNVGIFVLHNILYSADENVMYFVDINDYILEKKAYLLFHFLLPFGIIFYV